MGELLEENENRVTVNGVGLNGLKQPVVALDCQNSGTTMRLMSGILVGQNFPTTIFGDDSLNKRPMNRIINPLRQMGANINGDNDNYPPLNIVPTENLIGINYTLPVASAQVKSSILLASLYSLGSTNIIEEKITRDHTERMLDYFGANIKYNSKKVSILDGSKLVGGDIFVPLLRYLCFGF